VDDRAEADEWLPATVPGNVRSDLLALGRIEDPFYATSNEDSQWADAWDWWYVRPLSVDLEEGERAFLCFEGIDYVSAVYLDRIMLGQHEGMFSRQIYEITDLMKVGGSHVAVRIWGSNALPRRRLSWWEKLWSRVATALPRGAEPFPDRTATLKCQMSFGWDFAPRIRTMGIWDEVSLIVTGSVFIRDIFIIASLEEDQAHVKVQATLDSDRPQDVVAEVEWSHRGEPPIAAARRSQLTLDRGQQIAEVEFEIDNPHLWQPWDRGEPHVYELELRIMRQGQVLDSSRQGFGLRTLEMVPNPDAPPGSENWTFVVNGQREFIRGANWVPADALPGRLRSRDYETLVGMAREAGINLVRVWGGGLREKRAFYDACDREGIMVWQDFPLSYLPLGHFPSEDRFHSLAAREARSIVRQLRNHPSLIIWCGGNEISYRRNRRLVDTLEAVVEAEDGTRPFRKTSPGRGDSHDWRVWHGKAPIRDYRQNHSPFVSEFGLQSVPHLDSLSRFLPEEDLFPPGEGWRHHCGQLEKLERYARAFSPENLDQWVVASQKAQAYGLQVAIEHFRRRKYRTSGVIVWQFNDAWPAISWSVIDYYRLPKLAYLKLKAVFSPILVSLDYPLREYGPGDLFRARVWAINDLLVPCDDCHLEVSLDGERIFSNVVSLSPDSSLMLGQVEHRIGDQNGNLVAALTQGGQAVSRNEYDLHYHDPQHTRLLDILYSKLAEWLMN
jgi:beta-mannosidase